MTDDTRLVPPPRELDLASHAFFLDFDGTLAPIVDHPDAVKLAPETAELVQRLADACDGGVAIVTGRALASVRPHLGPLSLVVSGSHGHEIHWPDGPETEAAQAAELDAAFAALDGFASDRGLRIERKPGAVALHYRNAEHHGADARAAVEAAVAGDPDLRAIHGNMVSEAALARAGKGVAVRELLKSAPFRSKTPIMVGDDVTDEDGFRAAADLGGFGLRIGRASTDAAYQVETMDDFFGWLDGLLPPADGKSGSGQEH
ncbi:trehalose-phosphatase [Sulfitobacter sp. D35]|uniref:trehalose-phosphatase n=1 Tax=Sulfitobacter sp. D35 TaxID=3083252 RepID=UPI00296FDA85|nr:trehalose-phosphatase [Sulfitobacter sp. D35]MDW4500185.1 trehalose-phosphatase [Sulfitobacter sp. D35]